MDASASSLGHLELKPVSRLAPKGTSARFVLRLDGHESGTVSVEESTDAKRAGVHARSHMPAIGRGGAASVIIDVPKNAPLA